MAEAPFRKSPDVLGKAECLGGIVWLPDSLLETLGSSACGVSGKAPRKEALEKGRC